MTWDEETIAVKIIQFDFGTNDAKEIQSKVEENFGETIPLNRVYKIIDPNYDEDYELESRRLKYEQNYLF